MTRFRCSLLTVWLLICTGLAMDCSWDPSVDVNQTLIPAASIQIQSVEAEDEEDCKSLCCDKEDCDMALYDPQLKGGQHCQLVSGCEQGLSQLCQLQASNQFKVYRKETKGEKEGLTAIWLNESRETMDKHVDKGSVLPEDSTPAPPERPNKEMSSNDFSELCEAAIEVGPCKAAIPRWHYNREQGVCESFIYGGCRGNKNNYVNEKICIDTCTVTVLPVFKQATADEFSAEYRDKCMVTPDPGHCRAAFPKFYYDPNTDSCPTFIYGGCRGNNNRYDSKEECMSSCAAEGRLDSHGKSRNRWSTAFFLFVTLAVISALLLVTLIIVSLRRRNVFRRLSSVSDKEELLPDERSSVDSLTLPESPKPGKA